VYVGIIAVGIIVFTLLVPPLVSDTQDALKTWPSLVSKFTVILQDPNNKFIRWLPYSERLYLSEVPTQVAAFLQKNALDTFQKTLTVVLSTVSVIAAAIVVPVLTAYMLLDAGNLKRGFLGLLPPKRRDKAEQVVAALDNVVGGFIRGQLIDGAILGTMLTVALFVTHVPYALLIGVVSGALNFIPYAGAIIAFVPAVLLALAYGGVQHAVVVAVLIVIIHQIDGNFVSPRVLKDNVGLSPFWIVISILAGSELFGLVGTFLAVPAAAMLRVLREQLLPGPVSTAEAAPGLTSEPLAETRPPRRRA
jgi:predicted PurR-regulated permease PerM